VDQHWITDDRRPRAGALFVVIYVDFLVDGNPGKGQYQLLQYGAASINANSQHLLKYTVLQQLDRFNRHVILEVWDTQAHYDAWDGGTVTANFVTQITPLLGSPLDYRLNSLCGKTYVDGAGCTPP
jgi:quinol monooxygenase YgiN